MDVVSPSAGKSNAEGSIGVCWAFVLCRALHTSPYVTSLYSQWPLEGSSCLPRFTGRRRRLRSTGALFKGFDHKARAGGRQRVLHLFFLTMGTLFLRWEGDQRHGSLSRSQGRPGPRLPRLLGATSVAPDHVWPFIPESDLMKWNKMDSSGPQLH